MQKISNVFRKLAVLIRTRNLNVGREKSLCAKQTTVEDLVYKQQKNLISLNQNACVGSLKF